MLSALPTERHYSVQQIAEEPADRPSWLNYQTTVESPTRTIRTLETVLTDEEFAAVKKACIEAMK